MLLLERSYINPITPSILLWLLLFILAPFYSVEAQTNNSNSITINGYVKDAGNSETLIGATVTPKRGDDNNSNNAGGNIGTATNMYGFFALSVPQRDDSLTLKISYIGYQTRKIKCLPTQDLRLDVSLQPESLLMETVLVKENSMANAVRSNQMSVQKINAATLKSIPVIMGETDVLKVIQLTAGVQTGAEGTSGFYVRGGAADQNLILLDEAIVYNPEHFFGFFSTFNSDIIKHVEIYKGDFPAQYGGRLSSVLDVQMREGNMQHWQAEGGIGLISSRLTVEGPIQKQRSSFVLSGRRTYYDAFTPLINKQLKGDQQIPNYYFYDLNAKVNYQLGKKDRLYLSGYFGSDKLSVTFQDGESKYNIRWGNMTGTLRWNHIFSPKMFSNTSLVASRFKYRDDFNFNDFFKFSSSSATYNLTFKQDIDYFTARKHQIKFGVQAQYSSIRPIEYSAVTTAAIDTALQSNAISEKQQFAGTEVALYAHDIWQLSPKLSLKYGLRLSGFITGDAGGFVRPEPRLALLYQINPNFSFKAGYTRMAQYLHQVRFNALTFINPYFPSNQYIKPQLSDQIAAGWSCLLFDGQVSLSNEYYYKWLYHQLDYRNGASFLFIDKNYHTRLTSGRGSGYGGELQLEKKEGKLTGWVAYTLAWAWRVFDQKTADNDPNAILNSGKKFPFTYDRRHVLNIVAQYQLPKRWTLSANFTYRTGEALDLANGAFGLYNFSFSNNTIIIDPSVVPVYSEVNSFRMPAYHRLDVGISKKWGQPNKRQQSELAFSIYNVYSRLNAFFIYFDQETSNNGQVIRRVAKQVSLFPIIPAITYNFKI